MYIEIQCGLPHCDLLRKYQVIHNCFLIDFNQDNMIELIAHNVYQLEVSLPSLRLSTLLVLVYSHYHHTYTITCLHIKVYCRMSHISTLHVEALAVY